MHVLRKAIHPWDSKKGSLAKKYWATNVCWFSGGIFQVIVENIIPDSIVFFFSP